MLKPISPSCLSNYFLWFNDPSIRKWLSPTTPRGKADIKIWLDEISKSESSCYYSIYEKKKNIGHIGLKNINTVKKETEIGIVIGEKSMWNRGYGKKALTEIINIANKKFHLNKLVAKISKSNVASLKLFESAGFVLDGEEKKVRNKYFEYFSIVQPI